MQSVNDDSNIETSSEIVLYISRLARNSHHLVVNVKFNCLTKVYILFLQIKLICFYY